MFQTVFYSQLAAEEQRFTLSEVISDLVEKLVRRHPHVFPDGTLKSRKGDNLDSSGAVLQQWEDIKSDERSEKGHTSILDDVPRAFPALLRAQKLQKRAARVGFDLKEAADVFEKIEEEIAEVKEAVLSGSREQTEEELGDLLFSCVNLVRKMGHDSETALRRSSLKFEQRFRQMESQHGADTLKKMDVDELEALWQESKKALAPESGSGKTS
jgi:ATP diphosphatase